MTVEGFKHPFFRANSMKEMLYLPLVFFAAACAPIQQQPPQPVRLNFDPIDAKKFKSAQDMEIAQNIDYETCKAQSLQAAMNVPQPASYPPASNQTYIQNAPIVSVQGSPPPLPGIQGVDNSANLIAAHQAGEAARLRSDLARSTFISCMGQKGWALRS